MWEYTVASLSAALDRLPTTTTGCLFSSEHHPAPHSSTTCTGENGENIKALKKEYTMKEDARKRAFPPMLVDTSPHVINSLLPPPDLASPQFVAPDRGDIDGQC